MKISRSAMLNELDRFAIRVRHSGSLGLGFAKPGRVRLENAGRAIGRVEDRAHPFGVLAVALEMAMLELDARSMLRLRQKAHLYL